LKKVRVEVAFAACWGAGAVLFKGSKNKQGRSKTKEQKI
jgi:hypothetical protein